MLSSTATSLSCIITFMEPVVHISLYNLDKQGGQQELSSHGHLGGSKGGRQHPFSPPGPSQWLPRSSCASSFNQSLNWVGTGQHSTRQNGPGLRVLALGEFGSPLVSSGFVIPNGRSTLTV